MLLRILRTFCILLTLSTLCLWAASYYRAVGVNQKGIWLATVEWGKIYFTACDGAGPASTWVWSTYRAGAEPSRTGYRNSHHFAGFGYFREDAGPPWGSQWGLYIPLWFPTVVSVGLLWLVWRPSKTIRAESAFPVQPERDPAPQR